VSLRKAWGGGRRGEPRPYVWGIFFCAKRESKVLVPFTGNQGGGGQGGKEQRSPPSRADDPGLGAICANFHRRISLDCTRSHARQGASDGFVHAKRIEKSLREEAVHWGLALKKKRKR